MGLFSRWGKPPCNAGRAKALYGRLRPMRASGRLEAEVAGRRLEVFGRGCQGGASLLVREAAGTDVAFAILALHAEQGIEDSSFATPEAALDFVESVVDRLGM
jgi:hypothetical protein